MQKDSKPLVGVVLSETTVLSLDEFSCACTVEVESIRALVEEGIVEPIDDHAQNWRFSGASLGRAREALRLQRELELNLAGVALALDLLEEVRRLRRALERLEHSRR
jgi:chaperone modulatory protein CbpM